MKRTVLMWGIVLIVVIAALMATPIWIGAQGSSDFAAIRGATAKYHRLSVAEQDGFVRLVFPTQPYACISHGTAGAMGVHYFLPGRFDDQLTLTEPEVLIYDFEPNGKAKLVAVEYIVPAAAWSAAEPPKFLGQTLQYKTTVGPHSVDPYYELHVWTWRHNPSGIFADWNPQASCP